MFFKKVSIYRRILALLLFGFCILILANNLRKKNRVNTITLISQIEKDEKPAGSKTTKTVPPTTKQIKPQQEKAVDKPVAQKEAKNAETIEEPDNLRIIEGIGPKTVELLKNVGVDSFEKIAKKTPDELKQILKDAGMRAAKTDFWPEQAKLAANNKWQELKEYQEKIKS